MFTIFKVLNYNNIIIIKSITDYNMNTHDYMSYGIKNNNIHHKVFNNVSLRYYALK